jgi:hypothetical protein
MGIVSVYREVGTEILNGFYMKFVIQNVKSTQLFRVT